MGRSPSPWLAAIAVVLLAACAAPSPSTSPAPASAPAGAPGAVTVALVEWSIRATPPTAPAGHVAFSVRNEGLVPHDLLIIRSDLAPGGLTTVSGRLVEADLAIAGRTGQLTPGSREPLAATLPPGKYILVCNVVGHYNSGQFAGFTVQ